jgi:hypothetical protein
MLDFYPVRPERKAALKITYDELLSLAESCNIRPSNYEKRNENLKDVSAM